ncbi:hypothetical protein Cgig2_026378 [Carnegiea gigantea]|uniref:Uncharacterized protein n=1 Tax=Carnegiea gigantea TaxID=171969 RepID=A0A9Q1Q6C9_9CARY|nr:hypothetical protein Cgig2_026378 [Carnegiea gigantea]
METEEGVCQTPEKCRSPAHIIKELMPFCEEGLKPREGLECANLEECEKFYKSYTHHVGFSFHKSRSKTTKERSKPIFELNGIILEGRPYLEYEDKLISRNWLDFSDSMQVTGRDLEKLTLVSKQKMSLNDILKFSSEIHMSSFKANIKYDISHSISLYGI